MTVIKDEYVLSKNAWHARMMKYMWNLDAEDFSHMCPYFWLSFLNCLIFIPYFAVREGMKLLYKIVSYPFRLLANGVERGMKRYNERMKIVQNKRDARRRAKAKMRREMQIVFFKANPEKLLLIKQKDPEKYRTILEMIRWEGGEDFRTLQDKIEEVKERLIIQEQNKQMEAEAAKAKVIIEQKKEHFKKIYDGPTPIEELIEGDAWVAYYENYELIRLRKRQELIEARRRARKALIVKLVRIAKPIGTFVMYSVGIVIVSFVLYWLYLGVSWVGTKISNTKVTINWDEVRIVGLYSFYIAGIIGCGLGVLYSAIKFVPHTIDRIVSWKYDRMYRNMQKIYAGTWDDHKDTIEYLNGNQFISTAQRLRSIKNLFETGYTETSYTYKKRRNFSYLTKPFVKIASAFMYCMEIFPWIYNKAILPACRAIASFFILLFQMAKDRCPAIKWKQ